jgi:segregation and condensation protein A
VSAFEDDEVRASAPGALDEALLDPALDPALDEDGASDLESERADLEKAVAEAGHGADPGIALLLELARSGKIDPWNIDIIRVTDEYLRALDKLDPRDLARSARCIFYAAALVHLKARALAERHSRALLEATEAGDMALGPDELDAWRRGLRPGDGPLVYPDADAILTPRERKPRARGVTLLDLIMALRSFDERLAEREANETAIPAFDGEIADEECLGVTHPDDLERDKAEVRATLERRNAAEPGVPVRDTDLVTAAPVTGENAPLTRVGVFLALLSLSNDDEVILEQDALYGTLLVTIGPSFGKPRTPEPMPSEPVAAHTQPEQEERS